MSTDFLTVLRTKLQTKIDERAAAKEAVDAILAAPAAEGRSDLTVEETAAFTEARNRITALDAELDAPDTGIKARIAELETMEARRHEAAAKNPQTATTIKSEARTYSPTTSRRDGVSFLHDVAAAQRFGDQDAGQRLSRHMAEERVERPGIEQRAVATSAFAGLVVPQYLVDLAGEKRRAGRPFADIATKHPLPPEGMTVNISKMTTGSTAAVTAQNAAASETNMDDTLLTIDVITSAGQQTVSVQGLQRGSGIESVILGDLLSAVNTNVDSTMITAASTGLDAITDADLDIAYTDASPTVAELWPKLFDAVSQVQTNYFGGVSHFLMHPRRFWWIASNVGTSFPFVNFNSAGPQSGGSVNTTAYGQGASGVLGGIPVVVDANISTVLGAGTNEDAIYAITQEEVHLWEDEPVFIRAEQTAAASLGVLFVAYKMYAYTVNRNSKAHARINGTGLVTPTF